MMTSPRLTTTSSMRHYAVMNLTQYVQALRDELLVAAEAGGDEARALAERLTAPLESTARLVFLELLSEAASEITRELAPASVDVRIRGRDPEFVVTSPASTPPTFEDADEDSSVSVPRVAAPQLDDADESGTSRVTLRLPELLKLRVEATAQREGISVNAWLIRAVSAVLESGNRDRRSRDRGPSGGDRYTGWVR